MVKKFDERERLKEVNSYKIEDTLTEKEYDDIAFLASEICGTPIALVTLMYKDRQWFKAAVGTDLKENKRELSFCTHAIAGEEDVMMVENANEDVRFMHNPLVQGDPQLVFYAGASIVNKNGYTIGTVCVYDVVKKSLTNQQIKGLKILSEQVMGLLELRKQNLRLENDIYDKVEMHKLIEVSEAKFRNLILQAPVLITTFQGPSFIVETINKTALELWGKPYEQVFNKPLFEVSPEVEEGLKDILNAVYTTGESFAYHESAVQLKRTGKPDTAYFNSVYQPLRDLDNKIYGVIVIGTEVTEAVNNRKVIEKMAAHLKLATDSANVGTWSLDIKTQKLEWSAVHKRMWGYDEHRKDLEYEDWHKLILPGDKENAFEKIEEARANNTVYEAQYYINRANDGTLRYMRSFGKYYYNDKGEAETLTGISIDITEQKEVEGKIRQSEEMFKSIFDNSLAAIMIADDQGKYLSANKAASELLGYTVIELLQMNVGDLKTTAKSGAARRYKEYISKGRETGEFDFMTKNGEHKFGQYQATRIMADFNLSIMMDITEQRLAEEQIHLLNITLEEKVKSRTEELKTKNLELELTNAELSSFSYIASHDLKEPLRKIQTFSKRILETENFKDKTQNYFNRIIASSERMTKLIDSLLDFSRASSTELFFEECDLNSIVEESKNDLYISILEKQAIIEHENLPTIKAVCIQLSQLFTNLIDNSIKYSRPEIRPHIKITSERIAGSEIEHASANKQKEYHAIKITDNGIGFEAEYKTKIFEIFQRLHQMDEYSGTGIGLAIVKKIATNHNGFIVAEGNPNIGSTFTLYIPIR